MLKRFSKINLFAALMLTFIFLFSAAGAMWVHSGHLAPEVRASAEEPELIFGAVGGGAIIYYNEACGMCAQYVRVELPEMLKKQGVTEFIGKDYINEKSNRVEMNELMAEFNVPLPLQSHIMTFVGDLREGQGKEGGGLGQNYKYILGGHIPPHIIEGLFNKENSEKFKRVIVYQDKMHGEATDYKIWAIPAYADDFAGEIKTYPIDASVDEYLDYLEKNKDQLKLSGRVNNQFEKYKSLLPIVLVSGFLDGINPCAFAVLLFFIAFLFTLKRTRKDIWKMGVVYISSIYLAYLLIGFGILKAILFTDAPHFMAQVGAWLVIVLGVINLIGIYFPRFPLKLRIPHASKETLTNWIHKATLLAAFVLGFLVGLCTFPCSGGIYVAIIGLLAAKTTYWSGVSYLLLYNLMFIVPLIIILILASNKYAVEKLTQWEQAESKAMKILSAVTMVALGLIILIWFT